MEKIGIIHGRFQAFHNGHLQYILNGIDHCDHIFIGITNYDIYEEKPYNHYDSVRANRSSNPFSFYHRFMMIKNSLLESHISIDKFDIVPFPIEYPNKICQYVPMNGIFFIALLDEWDRRKLDIFKSLEVKTEVLHPPILFPNENRISGTLVRNNIRQDMEWKNLVPNAVYNYIIDNNLIDLVKKTY